MATTLLEQLQRMTVDELKHYINNMDDTELVEFSEEEDLASDVLNDKQKQVQKRSMPFAKFFGEMDLTKKQKEDRTDFAKEMEDALKTVLALIALEIQYNNVSEIMIVNQLATDYSNVARNYLTSADADWLSRYSQRYAEDFVDSTFKNLNDPWFQSNDRATFNAENEANTVLNRSDFTEAKNRGFFHKEWLTMEDAKVRTTHRAVDRQVIPIDDFFHVGDALMLYPKDVDNAEDHPEEIVNCRCSINYLP